MTNIKNLGSEEAPKWYFVTTILVNGEELEIIPAFTDYSLKHKNFEKDKVFKAIDKSKLLPTVFCFCDAKPFYASSFEWARASLHGAHQVPQTSSNTSFPL